MSAAQLKIIAIYEAGVVEAVCVNNGIEMEGQNHVLSLNGNVEVGGKYNILGVEESAGGRNAPTSFAIELDNQAILQTIGDNTNASKWGDKIKLQQETVEFYSGLS